MSSKNSEQPIKSPVGTKQALPKKPDPYKVCPSYESARLSLRFIGIEDAADLLECYAHPTLSVTANAENCDFGYHMQTLEQMAHTLKLWIDAYKNRAFIRLAICDKETGRAIGTLEIFDGGPQGHSILRLDLLAAYERRWALEALLDISDHFFNDLDCRNLVVKAVPQATERIQALEAKGYVRYPVNENWDRLDYYIKWRPDLI